jgi:hypothetical protein
MSDRTHAQQFAKLEVKLAEAETCLYRMLAKVQAARFGLKGGMTPARIGNLIHEAEDVQGDLAKLLMVAFGAADGWAHQMGEARQEAVVLELRRIIDRSPRLVVSNGDAA